MGTSRVELTLGLIKHWQIIRSELVSISKTLAKQSKHACDETNSCLSNTLWHLCGLAKSHNSKRCTCFGLCVFVMDKELKPQCFGHIMLEKLRLIHSLVRIDYSDRYDTFSQIH